MLTPISTILRLTRSDLGRQKRRLSIAAFLYGIAAIFFLFCLGFAGTALAVWLAEAYGLLVALVVVSAGCLGISAMAIIANAIYQRRQKRKLAQSAAVKEAAAATLISLAKRRASIAPLALAAVSFFVATQVISKNKK